MKHKYIPHTPLDISKMLEKIGVSTIDDLFKEIPKCVKLDREFNLPKGLSELEVSKKINQLANSNKGNNLVYFLGAGAYDHYIPSVVKHITSRSEFYTAYTPYQPEVSQGTLQYIFEFQTMITELTGLEASNASMYDGATSCSEAIMMANNQTRRKKALVSKTIHPNTIEVINTYGHYNGFEIEFINSCDGVLDLADLERKLDKDVSCVVVANPNFYGIIEDNSKIVDLIHNNKSLLIMDVNPMSLPILKTPGEIGADIVCGDAQVFGIPLTYGGPYLGFINTTKKLIRKLPGRICGQTTDVDGKRAFVLTLQAREQHIRRQKANSNICSNQSLNVLAATVYMATLGKKGLTEVSTQNIHKAHYAFNKIVTLANFSKVYNQPFFNEFVVKSNIDYEVVKEALINEGIVAGLDLGKYDEKFKNHILFCVTEKRSKEEIDKLVSVLGGLK